MEIISNVHTIDNEDSIDDALHLCLGHHLLIDIKGIDSLFLNSEQHLATVLGGLIKESQHTLVSYHHRSLLPMCVSCVRELLESYNVS